MEGNQPKRYFLGDAREQGFGIEWLLPPAARKREQVTVQFGDEKPLT